MGHVTRWVGEHRDSIIVVLLILSIGGAVVNFRELKDVQRQQGREQAATALQTQTACVRSRVFGPPLFDHLAKVEAILHVGALENTVEWPLGSHKRVKVLDFYRTTIPKSCPAK